MKVKYVRNILGPFFLVTTAFVGVYVIIFKGGPLLPITPADATGSLEILAPVFVGQLAIIVQNFGKIPDEKVIPVPWWVVVMPPILVILMFVTVICYVCLENKYGNPAQHLGENVGDTFRAVVTLAIALLNATTIIVINKFLSQEREHEAGSNVIAKSHRKTIKID